MINQTPFLSAYSPILPEIPKLPYATDALEPYLSAEALCFIIQNILPNYRTPSKTKYSLPIIEYLTKIQDENNLYRHTTEFYNHNFWFASMKAGGGGMPQADFLQKILEDFGSFDKFSAEFLKTATNPQSLDAKWVWLVCDEKHKLSVIATDRLCPLAVGFKPLIACNLWQHAYYLDYRDRRADYVQNFLNHLINWQHAIVAFHQPTAWLW